jgi:hypothetical protein
MAASVSRTLWRLGDIVAVVDAAAAVREAGGHDRRRAKIST